MGSALLVGVGGVALMRWRFRRLVNSGEHNDMIGVVLGMYAAIYGIILAFEQRERITAAMNAYVHAVVEKQWPLMREGRPDPNVTEPQVKGLYKAFQSYEPRTEAEQAYYSEAVSTLGSLASARRTRLADSQQQLPVLLSVLVYGGALIMLPLTFLYGIRDVRAQLMFVMSVAILIGVSVLLCLTLDRPFSGDLAVSPAPFRQGVLAQFWR